MLKKLLKYDLKYTFKFLLVFYVLAIIFALLARAFLGTENSFVLNIFGEIFRGASISMMFSIGINNLMRMWVWFKNRVYGDESYLTHTLPIEKRTHYLSKIITSVITMFVSVAVIALTLIVGFGTKENFEFIKQTLDMMTENYGGEFIIFVVTILFVLFLELLNALQCGFTGIIMGYRMYDKKIGFSVFFGFLTYMISQGAALAAVFLASAVKGDFNTLFSAGNANFETLKGFIYIALSAYTAIIIINCIVNIKLFKKGVNVD